jgi:hypothetical protein
MGLETKGACCLADPFGVTNYAVFFPLATGLTVDWVFFFCLLLRGKFLLPLTRWHRYSLCKLWRRRLSRGLGEQYFAWGVRWYA